MPDYYDILGLTPDATMEQIRKAFRRLAMEKHPDRNKAADADKEFAGIMEAYEVLKDPNLRRRYDAMRAPGKPAAAAPDPAFAAPQLGDTAYQEGVHRARAKARRYASTGFDEFKADILENGVWLPVDILAFCIYYGWKLMRAAYAGAAFIFGLILLLPDSITALLGIQQGTHIFGGISFLLFGTGISLVGDDGRPPAHIWHPLYWRYSHDVALMMSAFFGIALLLLLVLAIVVAAVTVYLL